MYRDHRHSKFFASRLAIVGALAVVALFGATQPVIAQNTAIPAEKAQPAEKPCPECAERKALARAPVQEPMTKPAPAIRYVPGLEEPLVSIGWAGTPQENKDLDDALAAYKAAPDASGPQGDFSDFSKPLLAFIDAHPKSNWNVALWTNIGLGYYHDGYYSLAMDAWEKAWQQGRNATTPQATAMVDRAVGELARMHARLGHEKELTALFKDIGKRPIGGAATERITNAREGLWSFHHNPGMAYLCGPLALKHVLEAVNASDKQIKVADDARSGTRGFSLSRLDSLADKAGLKHKLIFRKAGQPVPVPSIINWKTHHYAAITDTHGGLYDVADPTFGDAGGARLTQKAIDAEGSGYFLVPAKLADKASKNGWRVINANAAEIKSVYGMGDSTQSTFGADLTYDVKMTDAAVTPVTCQACKGQSGNNRGWSTLTGLAGLFRFRGMAVADAHAMLVSLHLADTPVGYAPQKGIPAFTTVTYNQREAEQPANFSFSNLSAKWSHTWMAYIQDYPGTGHEGQSVRRVAGGGGGWDYSNSYNSSTGALPNEAPDYSQLVRTPTTGTATSYTRTLPDGSKEVYSLSNGAATYPRLMFLTSVVDAQGNTTTLNYDGSFRLTSFTDAMGRSTTFTYGLSSYPLLITKITDPFSRSTQITYDSSQRLSTITDPVGIVSSFTYSAYDPTFITGLTTPYGTSTYSELINSYDPPEQNTRSLMMTDPLGNPELIYYYQNPNIVPANDPVGVPSGMASTDNGYLNWRNTFYWDRHAFPLAVTYNTCGPVSEDFTKARITHWYHDPLTGSTLTTGRAVGSTKQPLENRVWLDYPGQPNNYSSGAYDHPQDVGRILDDSSTQHSYMTYMANTYLPNLVYPPIPYTREIIYNYNSNNIDVSTIKNYVGSTLATFGSYNTLHEPQTYAGADGQTWNYTYTASGQIATIKDPSSNTTTYNYDSSNRLSTIVNANTQTVLTLTYDSDDRVQTRKDSEGYILTYAYDNLDRVTSITYPDSTTDTFDYTFQSGPYSGTPSLELRKYTDRLGRVTTYSYDADQRLTSVTEPLTSTTTRTTSYDYYEDGALKDITDANGNVTHWDIDIQSRPVDKIYAYGTAQAQEEYYTYENTTSRLKSVKDALAQVKTYAYDLADEVTGITYTSSVNTTPNVTFTWDANFPRITKMVDGTGTTNYSYTAVGSNGALQLSSIAGPYTNDTLSLTYDALGRLSGETISGGNESFTYDAISRPTGHTTPLGSFTNTFLGQTNQITGRSVTNGSVTVSTSWGYDTNTNDRRLLTVTNSGVTRSFTLAYGTSPVNPYDIMSITDTAATGHPWATQSHAYTYDYSDRLLTASYTTPGNFTYAYDPLDNPTTWTTPGGTTNPTYNDLNQISTWGSLTYAYDADGNLTSGDGVKTYKWDAENRLIEIDYVGSTAKSQFTYNGIGQRRIDVETASGGGTTTTRYMWCAEYICQTRDGSDNVLRRHMAEGEYNVSGTQKLVYMPDQLGAVRDVLDATTGNLVKSYDYAPYGAITRSNGSTATDYEFAELFSHPNSTLNLSTTRPFDPATGRWLGKDPIREDGGINLYSYNGANPVNAVDPKGEFVGVLVAAGAAAVAFYVLTPQPANAPTGRPGEKIYPLTNAPSLNAALAFISVAGTSAVRTMVSAAKKLWNAKGCPPVEFGNNPNATEHAFRWTDKAGLARSDVEAAVRADLEITSSEVVSGKPFNKTIDVQGMNITYTAWLKDNGVINVGRIVIPK